MESRLGQHGKPSVEDWADNTAGELHTRDKTAADSPYLYLTTQLPCLASNLIQAFYIVMFRYGGGAVVVGFALQVLFFYLKAWRANKFENEEERHDWLEKHNTQRQRCELITSALVSFLWNLARQVRLCWFKDRAQLFRGCWTQQERPTEDLIGAQGWWAHLMTLQQALIVTWFHDVKAATSIRHWAQALAAHQGRRSSKDSEISFIKSEAQGNWTQYVCAGVQTEKEDNLAAIMKGQTDELAVAEQAAHVKEIQSFRWPEPVHKDRISFLIRFRDLTSQEEKRKARLMLKDRDGQLTSHEMRDLKDLELLNFEAQYTTLKILQAKDFHGFDGILSPSATNEDVWQLLLPTFWAFSTGRPICVFFDGYSGTGKSYTMFKGPNAIAGQFTWALDAFLRIQGLEQKFDMATATLQYDRGKNTGKIVKGPCLKGASLQEAQKKIKEAWQQRDKSNRKTTNNLESSRSHLIIELSVDVQIGGKRFHSFLGLVDLAGNEKETQGHDLGATKTAKDSLVQEEAETEQQAAERNFIHNSRSALQSSLINPTNLSLINSSEFTRYLRRYLYVETMTQNQPESKPQKSLNRGTSPAKNQEVKSTPKIFHISCLSPFKSNLPQTLTTLTFATQLQSKRAAKAIRGAE